MWHLSSKMSISSFSKTISAMLGVTIFEIPIWISKVIIQPVKANRSWIKRAQGWILFANSTNQSHGLTERLACALNANKNSIQANVSSFYTRCIGSVPLFYVYTFTHYVNIECQHYVNIECKWKFNSGKRFLFLRWCTKEVCWIVTLFLFTCSHIMSALNVKIM